jgi:hypothetical protein
MAVNIIIPQPFLAHASIKLGRFVTNIDHPNLRHHDPPCTEPPKQVVSPRDCYIGLDQKSTGVSIGSALTSFISASISKRAKTQVRFIAEKITTYTLDNSDEWFENAVRIPTTRTWIERAIDKGDDIYMIVGFHVIANARIIQGVVRGKDLEGRINLPVSAMTGVVPISSIIDPSIRGDQHKLDSSQSHFIASGEQVCAFQYRKLRHRWLSSRTVDTSELSKVPRWSSVERGRDDEEGEDDIIEVELTAVDDLDGEWDRQEVSEGEYLVIRPYKNE